MPNPIVWPIIAVAGAINQPAQLTTSSGPDYGIDLMALDDLPDPEVLVSGELNAAYAAGRRLLTPDGALAEIGDLEPYDSVDTRDLLGARVDANAVASLNSRAGQILSQDERVSSAKAAVEYVAGALKTTAQLTGAAGPFSLVLSVDGVTASLLKGS